MPNHKSCKKRMKTSENQRLRNRSFRTNMRGAIKEVREAQSKDVAIEKLKSAIQIIDRAASAGLIHRRNADRNKSRLTLHVNRLN